MGRNPKTLHLLLPLWLLVPSARPALAGVAETLFPIVAKALETGDRTRLAELFPSDRKVMVSLHQIAELQGFAGSGPLVEALSRYIAKKDEVRFEREADAADRGGQTDPPKAEGPLRLRGTLISKDKAGRRERITLVFVFERVGAAWRAVEVRETG